MLDINEMPSEESRRKFTDWFKKNYPQEYYFFHQIESNLDILYLTKHPGLREGVFGVQPWLWKFGQGKW